MPIDLRKGKVINSEEEDFENMLKENKQNLDSSRYGEDNVAEEIEWEAPEYEVYEKSTIWYVVFGSIILLIVAYAIYSNSPIMAATFVLAGVVGYINLQKEPQIVEFRINYKGIRAGNELYEYENIKSFWIFYDPPHTRVLSLHTNAALMPFIHIPLGDEDPVEIREMLIEFIPEIKQEPSIVDALSRFLHI